MNYIPDNAFKLAQYLGEAGRNILALTDARSRMRPARTGQPQLRPLTAKWQGEAVSGMVVESFLHDPRSDEIFLNVSTNRKGMYVLIATDLEAMLREDKKGVQYNLSKAKATIYNEQHIPKRKVDLSPHGAEVYKNVAEFGIKFLKPAMRKLSTAVQGFMRTPEEDE